MTTTEKLQRIRARCVELTSIYDNAEPHTPLPAVAGWRATIAAIDMLSIQAEIGTGAGVRQHASNALGAIIAAWPEELL